MAVSWQTKVIISNLISRVNSQETCSFALLTYTFIIPASYTEEFPGIRSCKEENNSMPGVYYFFLKLIEGFHNPLVIKKIDLSVLFWLWSCMRGEVNPNDVYAAACRPAGHYCQTDRQWWWWGDDTIRCDATKLHWQRPARRQAILFLAFLCYVTACTLWNI